MGILDSLTGAPARQAANQQRGYLEGVQRTGNAQLDNAYQDARGALLGGVNLGRDALASGYGTATGAVGTGAQNALGYINQGVAGAQGAFGQAGNSLADLAGKYGGGTSLYLDALGVTGPEGAARAKAAFTPSLGYDFTLGQGLDSIARVNNARSGGAGAGGNLDRSAMDYASGLASKEYGGWLDRLGGLVNPELAATTSRAGLSAQEAALLANAGNARAGIATNEGGRLADLATGYGAGVAGLETNQGRSLADLATGNAQGKVGLATNIAPQFSNTYGQEAAAQMQASGNLLNLGTNLAQLAFGGSGTQSLGNMFGGGAGAGGAGALPGAGAANGTAATGGPGTFGTYGFNPLQGAFAFGGIA